ncbi:hypothetical protein BYT27DRAFT_7204724 [Phlegmacium glaucopus]|nr:hypothetical protein BYT27DRAFT_7204724 [Phlegmacium glaucopus]
MIIDGQNHSEELRRRVTVTWQNLQETQHYQSQLRSIICCTASPQSSFAVVTEDPFSFQRVFMCFSASGWSKTIQISRHRDELGPIEQR